MKYPFNRESLDKVSTSSIAIDASLRNLVCEFMLRIDPDKIENSQSYVEINEQEKPYIEIKVMSSQQGLSLPVEILLYNSDIEFSIGKVTAIESFNVKTQKDIGSLQRELSKWLGHRIKEVLFFKGDDLFKTTYKYFDGKKFRSHYFEIGFKGLFWMGRKEEKIYEPWIS
jgi:hypothetical protein